MPSFRTWIGIATAVVALDQATKFWASHALFEGIAVEVTSFFNLALVRNRGAAFSLLANAGGWQQVFFVGFALVASAIILHLLRRHPGRPIFSAGLALVLGGAIGNVIDRLALGAVVDFLDFHAFGWHWPAFNVADSAITVGVVLLLWDSLRKPVTGTTPAGGGSVRL